MWIALSVLSALMLGFYDVAKKQSLRRNSVLWVLFVTTSISTLLMAPFASAGPLKDHLLLAVKALLVSASWISGLAAMNLIPLTTLSSLKASRPVFVVLLSCIMFGERLTLWQWVGVGLVFGALLLLSKESAKEGIAFSHSRGVAYAWVAVFTGVASALFDKYLLGFAEPLFVQFWSDLYISVIMLLCLLVQAERGKAGKFKWDWTLVLIALLITGADFLFLCSQVGGVAPFSGVSCQKGVGSCHVRGERACLPGKSHSGKVRFSASAFGWNSSVVHSELSEITFSYEY